ncbi:hypothetical protein CK203_017755 [Vitis vinifera]|uniref:SAWADEE domain-containing protein n=1 Tax=Vitis vinifera TaxID=29760 RepID=A0A438JGS8_VITVI|nr:hypothetical protein CK203_017755 [Vitis vinifera]
MAPRKSTSTLSSQQFPLEFQADDDAWYAIRLLLHGKTLIIKYERFSADYDDFFKAAEFMNLDDVESFGWRFRKRMIFASTTPLWKRYNIKSTNFESGEEKCLCNFILNWQHGPNVGNLTSATVGHICLIQHSTGIDPKVASFQIKGQN